MKNGSKGLTAKNYKTMYTGSLLQDRAFSSLIRLD